MNGMWLFAMSVLAAGCQTGSVTSCVKDLPQPLTAETVFESVRDEQPEGLSGISHIAGNRYCCVDDSGGLLYEVEIVVSAAEDDATFRVVRSVKLDGRTDLEGCAWDPLDGRVWVSDEHDHSIRQFDPKSGRETAAVTIPACYSKHMRPNRSFEGLAISPDGLHLYAANEDTLTCDGAPADTQKGGVVRIHEFVRSGKGDSWRSHRQFFYPTEKIEGEKYGGTAISGVAALCATGKDTLLVLEREMSQKNPLFPSFRARLFEIRLSGTGERPEKRLVWDEDTMFSNYEAICPGPVLKGGTRTLVLVSDGDGEAEERLQVLALH